MANKKDVTVPAGITKAMKKIIAYSFDEECKHFEETYNVTYDPDKNIFIDQETGKEIPVKNFREGKRHIFMELLKVNDFLSSFRGK